MFFFCLLALVVSLSICAAVLFMVMVVAGIVVSYVLYRRVRRERSYKAQMAVIKDIEERNSSTSSSNGEYVVTYVMLYNNIISSLLNSWKQLCH